MTALPAEIKELSPAEYLDIEGVKAWERIPQETDRAWAAFAIFRDLGSGRNQPKVAKATDERYKRIQIWASKYLWAERTRRWDIEKDHIYREELFARMRRMAQRHANQAEKQLIALMKPAEAIVRKFEADPESFLADLDALDVKKLMAMVQANARVSPSIMGAERLALGMPTEISQENVTHEVDYGDTERLTSILDILGSTGLLAHILGEGASGEIIDAEAVEVHPSGDEPDAGRSAPEADGLSPSSTA